MEIRIDESCSRRRQETYGQTEKTGKTHHATAVENDVAINEDLIPLVHSSHADVVRASTPSHRTRQSGGLSSMARSRTLPAERIHVVSLLLVLSRHNLQSPFWFRNGRRLVFAQTIPTDQKLKTALGEAAQQWPNNTLCQEENQDRSLSQMWTINLRCAITKRFETK